MASHGPASAGSSLSASKDKQLPRPPRLGQGPSLSQVSALSNTTLQQENPAEGSRVLRRDHGKMSVRENRGKVIATRALKGLLEGVT